MTNAPPPPLQPPASRHPGAVRTPETYTAGGASGSDRKSVSLDLNSVTVPRVECVGLDL